MSDEKTANECYVERNHCGCHPETCCCDPWIVCTPDGECHSTFRTKETAEDVAASLNAKAASATKSMLLAEAKRLLRRYRDETPLGNQPHMIAHETDAFFARCVP